MRHRLLDLINEDEAHIASLELFQGTIDGFEFTVHVLNDFDSGSPLQTLTAVV